MDEKGSKRRPEIYSKVVRAGKRTYFFDVKQTRKGDLYLTMTESKKIFDKDQSFHFEKHKIFLYKEDFEKFHEAYEDAVGFIEKNVDESIEKGGLEPQDTNENNPEPQNEPKPEDEKSSEDKNEFTDVSFEDLDEEDPDKQD